MRIDSTAPTAPTECPSADLGAAYTAGRWLPTALLIALPSATSPTKSAGRVGVDVVDVGRLQTCELDCPGHRMAGLFAVGVSATIWNPSEVTRSSHDAGRDVGAT